MKEARLHIRLEFELYQQVRKIAAAKGVTLTHLVDQFFRKIVEENVRPKSDEELGVDQA